MLDLVHAFFLLNQFCAYTFPLSDIAFFLVVCAEVMNQHQLLTLIEIMASQI